MTVTDVFGAYSLGVSDKKYLGLDFVVYNQ